MPLLDRSVVIKIYGKFLTLFFLDTLLKGIHAHALQDGLGDGDDFLPWSPFNV